MGITFIGALIVLLLTFYFITGYQSGFKDIIGAIYFALWITALLGLWLYIIQPYLKDRLKKKTVTGTESPIKRSGPVPSPHSNLPLRDRIREYVAERRKEEGLPVPEPLRPSKVTTSSKKTPANSDSSGGFVPVAAATAAVTDRSVVSADDEGDLPLPDGFDEVGSGDIFGDDFTDEEEETSLPGIEDGDFGSYDETGTDEQPVTESGDLPDFDGDLESDMSESDLSDSMPGSFDTEEPSSDFGEEGNGGLSDEGLADFDVPLDDSMMDDDFSDDGDLTDIEFEDLEPDEV